MEIMLTDEFSTCGEISTPDRILKELGLIREIYNIQFSKYDSNNWFSAKVFDKNGEPVDGRFMHEIYICSENEFLNIQSCKKEFTHRYENTQKPTLLKNQLSKIREKAVEVREFYNHNLIDNGGIATSFYNYSKEIRHDTKAHIDFVSSHRALILIGGDYFLPGVYYGCGHELLLSHKPKFIWCPERYKYLYSGNNFFLAKVCQSLIDFVDDIFRADEPEKIKPEYDYSKVLTNYEFWINNAERNKGDVNIFDGINEASFINMIDNADFSSLDKRGQSQRVKYNIVVLSRLLGKEWGGVAAEKLKTTLRECEKMTSFPEFPALKSMYL